MIIFVGLGAGYYFAYGSGGSGNQATVTWSMFPLKIIIGNSFSGSGSDSFACSSTNGPVTLKVTNNYPNLQTASVSQSTFPSCGSTPDQVTVTVTCQPGLSAHDCGDVPANPSELITVCGPTPYTCLSPRLEVNAKPGT